MADDFNFNVKANVNDSIDKLTQVSAMMNKIVDMADKGIRNDNFLSGSAMNQSIDSMRQLNQLTKTLKINLDNISQSSFMNHDMKTANWASQAQSFVNQNMNNAQSSFNSITKMNQSTTAGAKANYSWNQAMSDYTSPTTDDMNQYSENRSYVRRLQARQLHRMQAATSSGHMTSEGRDLFYQENQQGLDRFQQYRQFTNDTINKARDRMTANREKIRQVNANTGLPDEERSETVTQSKQEIDADEQLIKKLKDFSDELNRGTENLKKYQSSLEESNPSVSGARGTVGRYFHDRASTIAYHTIGSATGVLSGQENAGLQLNSSTDDQAINLSYASGLSNDQAVRDTLFNVNQQRSNGYNLQSSMDLYQMSLLRNGYNGGDNSQSTSMVNAMEQGGNDTGIGRQAYQSLMGTMYNSGVISHTSDVNSVNNDVTGLNVYARTAGMQQQQAKTFQNLTNQIGQNQIVSSNQANQIAASEAGFARYGGRDLQGTQGQRALEQFQGGMIAGGEGKNSQLLQLMVQSNPQKYGGLSGMERAEEDMSKGLGSQSNIGLARNLVRQSGGSRQGALMLQHMYGVSNPREARRIASVLDSNNMSSAEQARRIRQIQRDGRNRRSSNQNKYNGSTTATRNQHTAEKDRQYSQTDSAYQKTIGKASNLINKMPTWMTTLVGTTGKILTILATQAASGMLQSGISALSEGKLTGDDGILSRAGDMAKGKFTSAQDWLHSGRTGRAMDSIRDHAGKTRDWFRSGRTGRVWDNVRDHAGRTRDWFRSGRTGRVWDNVRDHVGRTNDWLHSGRTGRVLNSVKNGADRAKDWFSSDKVGDAVNSATRDGGFLAKTGRFAGRANDVALVATSALQFGHDLTSKHPVRNTINDAGGLGGGLAGAAEGATLGTAILPGVGTIAGGLIGSFAGSSAGQWATSKVTGLFGGHHHQAKKGANDLHDQQKSRNSNLQNDDTQQDTINIRHERENLEYFERLLDKEDTLLKESKKEGSNLFNKNGSSNSAKSNKSKNKRKQKKSNKATKRARDRSKSANNARKSAQQSAKAFNKRNVSSKRLGKDIADGINQGNKGRSSSGKSAVDKNAAKKGIPEFTSHAHAVMENTNVLTGKSTSISSLSPNYDIKVNVNGDVKNGNSKGHEIANGILEQMKNSTQYYSQNNQVLNGGQAN